MDGTVTVQRDLLTGVSASCYNVQEPTVYIPQIPELLKVMRDSGVAEFKYGGLEVKFSPHFHEPQFPGAEEFDEGGELSVKEDPKEATERIKRAQKQASDDLFWST